MIYDGLPIIFFQRLGSGSFRDIKYLFASVHQARHASPASPIFIISDAMIDFDIGGVKIVSPVTVSQKFEKFRNIYQHFNLSKEWYISLAYERVFAIGELAQINNFKSFLHIESDVMLHVDATKEIERLHGYRMTISSEDEKIANFGNVYVMDETVFPELTDYLIRCYTDPKKIQHYKNVYNDRIAKGMTGGGISEMTQLGEFWRLNKSCIFNTNTEKDGIIYNHNIHTTSRFVAEAPMRYGRKRLQIYWIAEKPHFKKSDSESFVQAASLHLHAQAKFDWMEYCSFPNVLELRNKLSIDKSYMSTKPT